MSYQSITFGSNGEVGITVNTPQLARFNTGADAPATQGSSTVRVQLRHNDGLVKVGDYETPPEVAEALRQQLPEALVEPAVKEAQAAQAAATAKAEEAALADINRFVDDAAEGVAMHISNDVAFSD